MIKKKLCLLAATTLILSSTPAWALRFANQFTEFELPPKWQCNLEGAEWVCQSTEEAKKKDAIIVLAAKLKGDQDSLDQYMAYLKGSKSWTSVQGKQLKSDVKSARTSVINDQTWVDALHLQSEISGFYTRYLATVKQDIGVLITYSINKDKYQQYVGEFEAMVKTLKVFRKPGGVNLAPANGNLFTQVPRDLQENTLFPTNIQIPTAKTPKPERQEAPVIPIAIGAGIVLFIIWRRSRNRD